MSLLSIVQSAAVRLNIVSPTVVATSSDLQVKQLFGLLNAAGDALSREFEWQALLTEGTFTTVAAEIQGAIATIAPGYRYIINDTIWNRTLRRPVFGPIAFARWQQLKAMSMQGPWNQYRIRGGNLIMIPNPVAGQSCYFEYVTTNWCTNAAGNVAKSAMSADDDMSLLDEEWLALSLIWRFKRAKGLTFTTEYMEYDDAVNLGKQRDGMKDLLDLSGSKRDIFPGITIPSGNWMS